MIIINNLFKKYNEKTILNNISLKITDGDFFSIFGKNGAGKSTTIGIITSLINKDKGEIIISNYDIDKNKNEIKSLIGFVPQEYNFNQFESVLEIILNQAGYYGIPRKYAIQKAELLLKIFNLLEKKETIAMKLSGGMKRCLMIIRALIHDPKILILDEPTAGVDIISRKMIWNFLKQINNEGKTIVLTTHYLEEIEKLCKNVAIIHEGKILTQTNVKDLIEKVDNFTYLIETEKLKKYLSINKKSFKIKTLSNYELEVCINRNKNFNYLLKILKLNNVKIKTVTKIQNNLEKLLLNFIK